jgi:predicted 3-demethylubiquinone-9 3-methyltransferase (glyoxalase superfamily)
MVTTQRITPCLWFADEGEEAARFYTGIFPNSRITAITRYSEAGFEVHHRPAGSVMTVSFELDGQSFTFNEAVSFQVNCATQEEIDDYWEKLGAGGDPKAQQCGWLKDRYGLSWQIIPNDLDELYADPESPGAKRVMEAMLKMKKIDVEAMRRARDGAS